ncbi:hypothetical protein BCR36DRAFT_583851 [Piromyces finnis]|uniref:NDT80 domain-containing protein n=1 Tax=Piromyces finnis TaxID=1754191 RepID=A0A1Y1V7V2_9FUNG|nr:hypothetical protein BCR36DRAFT_583851 [Piromyces finnis]|eukprot:ORX49248.1 hypothetical protein BCR36DRAFT_583851 [Piromyces finnis]
MVTEICNPQDSTVVDKNSTEVTSFSNYSSPQTDNQVPGEEQKNDEEVYECKVNAIQPETRMSDIVSDEEFKEEVAKYSGPPFSGTIQVLPIFNLDKSKSFKIDLQAKVDRGFFLNEGIWICYRRNYFQVKTFFNLIEHRKNIPERNELPHSINNIYVELPDRGISKVINFYVGIEAIITRCNGKVEIVQHTAKRDKASQKSPGLRLIYPGGDLSSYNHSLEQNTIVLYERLQFRKATSNNGKRATSQQFYSVVVKLYGQLVDGENIPIAYIESSPIVVRGRSPGHYAQQTNSLNRFKILTPNRAQKRSKKTNFDITPSSSTNSSPISQMQPKYQNISPAPSVQNPAYYNGNINYNQNQGVYDSSNSRQDEINSNSGYFSENNNIINGNPQQPISPISPMNYHSNSSSVQNSPTNPTNFTYNSNSKQIYNASTPNYSNSVTHYDSKQQPSSYEYSYPNNNREINRNNNYNGNNYQNGNYNNNYNGQFNYEDNRGMTTNKNQNGFQINPIQNQNNAGSTFYNSQNQNQGDSYSLGQPLYNGQPGSINQTNQTGSTVSIFNNNVNVDQQGNYNAYSSNQYQNSLTSLSSMQPTQPQAYQIQSPYQQPTNSTQQFSQANINNEIQQSYKPIQNQAYNNNNYSFSNGNQSSNTYSSNANNTSDSYYYANQASQQSNQRNNTQQTYSYNYTNNGMNITYQNRGQTQTSAQNSSQNQNTIIYQQAQPQQVQGSNQGTSIVYSQQQNGQNNTAAIFYQQQQNSPVMVYRQNSTQQQMQSSLYSKQSQPQQTGNVVYSPNGIIIRQQQGNTVVYQQQTPLPTSNTTPLYSKPSTTQPSVQSQQPQTQQPSSTYNPQLTSQYSSVPQNTTSQITSSIQTVPLSQKAPINPAIQSTQVKVESQTEPLSQTSYNSTKPLVKSESQEKDDSTSPQEHKNPPLFAKSLYETALNNIKAENVEEEGVNEIKDDKVEHDEKDNVEKEDVEVKNEKINDQENTADLSDTNNKSMENMNTEISSNSVGTKEEKSVEKPREGKLVEESKQIEAPSQVDEPKQVEESKQVEAPSQADEQIQVDEPNEETTEIKPIEKEKSIKEDNKVIETNSSVETPVPKATNDNDNGDANKDPMNELNHDTKTTITDVTISNEAAEETEQPDEKINTATQALLTDEEKGKTEKEESSKEASISCEKRKFDESQDNEDEEDEQAESHKKRKSSIHE